MKASPSDSRGLRIAVDFPWDASACMGTGAYSETMVRALAQIAPEATIYLLTAPGTVPRVRVPNIRYLPVPPVEAREEAARQVGIPSLLKAIHADCLFAPASLLPLVRVCPMVATVHDITFATQPETYAPSLVHFLDRWFWPSLRVADRLVAVSEETRSALVSSGKAPPEKVETIEQPVREVFQGPLPTPQSEVIVRSMGVRFPYFFHVSNLSVHKNVFFALAVFLAYLRSHPQSEARFIVAGGGAAPNKPPDFMAKAEEMGIGERVVYAGKVSDLELKALYQECEAFLFPSLAEGWGLPVAEARSLGTRILASPHVPAADPAQRIPLKVENWLEVLVQPRAHSSVPKLTSTLESAGRALLGALKTAITMAKGSGPAHRELVIESPRQEEAGERIAIRADWRSPSGLGEAARNLYSGLHTAGLRASPVWVPKDGIQKDALWPGKLELFRETADVWIHALPPDYYDLSLPGKHVGLLFWETDRLPEDKTGALSWREELSRLDEIWVTTPFLKGVIEDSGVRRPVQVIPLPIDTELYSPGPRRLPPLDLPQGFDPSWTVILYVGTWDPRKRPDLLVRAFTRAFDFKDRALLLLKCYVTGDESRDRVILDSWVNESRAGSGHVRIIPQVLGRTEMADLYRSATLFATASRGEGLCLPAVQANSCGKPVLGVRWSALGDWVDLPVRHQLERVPREVKLPGYSESQRWAAIDLEDLGRQLRWAHDHRAEVAALGRKAREKALSNLSVHSAAPRLFATIRNLCAGSVQTPTEGALV